MKIDDEMMQRVLTMFRRGNDTKGISDALEIREATIERVLHAALAADRQSRNIINNGEGHA